MKDAMLLVQALGSHFELEGIPSLVIIGPDMQVHRAPPLARWYCRYLLPQLMQLQLSPLAYFHCGCGDIILAFVGSRCLHTTLSIPCWPHQVINKEAVSAVSAEPSGFPWAPKPLSVSACRHMR
jgi:hypothetical protein